MCEMCRIIELKKELERRKRNVLRHITAGEFLKETDVDEELAAECFDTDMALKGHLKWKYDGRFFRVSDADFFPIYNGYGCVEARIFRSMIEVFKGAR